MNESNFAVAPMNMIVVRYHGTESNWGMHKLSLPKIICPL